MGAQKISISCNHSISDTRQTIYEAIWPSEFPDDEPQPIGARYISPSAWPLHSCWSQAASAACSINRSGHGWPTPISCLALTHHPAIQSLTGSPGEPIPTWEGKERVNILVMGIDARPGEEGPWRTDTMMVLTVDPLTLSAGMLSIPRDLWVPIPGYGEGRINTANYLGDAYDYPGGGPALAARTVQYNLGVPIHHYVRVDFSAFVHLVDLIGGIDIYVPEEINDPWYPGPNYDYDPLVYPGGMGPYERGTGAEVCPYPPYRTGGF